MNANQLIDRLLDGKVPLEQWGSQATDKIAGLAKQVESGSATMFQDASGNFAVKFRVAKVCLFRDRHFLVKDKAGLGPPPYPRGLIGNVVSSLSVPIRHGEYSYDTAVRAIRGFFSLTGDSDIKPVARDYQIVGPTMTGLYPGLRVIHALHSFDWDVSDECYSFEGYYRLESGWTVRYEWLKLE